MIFQYGLEPVLIHRILIDFQAIPEMILQRLKKTLINKDNNIHKSEALKR